MLEVSRHGLIRAQTQLSETLPSETAQKPTPQGDAARPDMFRIIQLPSDVGGGLGRRMCPKTSTPPRPFRMQKLEGMLAPEAKS